MNPVCVIQLDNWHGRPQAELVMNALSAGGHKSMFVGGCVRDALLERPVNELDIATPEPPERVVTLLEAAGLKAIKTGIEHGTVTAICDGISFQITTLRQDIETFGRYARVKYTQNWAKDAARRDLTLNALYCDIKGNVFDPLGGWSDLKAGRIRFVGDAHVRIKEDLLRLLRYFRFYAYYGCSPADEKALTACSKMAPRIKKLSIERVWHELSRLLNAPNPVSAVMLMHKHAILPYLLPEAIHCDLLDRLVQLEQQTKTAPDYLRRITVMVSLSGEEACLLTTRFKFSKLDRKRFCILCDPPEWPDPKANVKQSRAAIYRLGKELFAELVLIGAAKFPNEDWLALLALSKKLSIPAFTVNGSDVVSMGIPVGPQVGKILQDVENWWINGDFQAGRDDCLNYLRSVIN